MELRTPNADNPEKTKSKAPKFKGNYKQIGGDGTEPPETNSKMNKLKMLLKMLRRGR